MKVISNNKQYYSIKELKNMGYTYYAINNLIRNGILQRLNRFTFENMFFCGVENDFFTANAYVPEGVICLMSAARYYDLTSFLPDSVTVAIERKKKVSTLPDWPDINVYYFNQTRMDTGVVQVHDGDNIFRIFDIEKTVIDIICYRNKIGIEETAEVIRNYLKRSDRQLDRLYAYSQKLKCEKILRTYLEVLL